MQCWTCAFSPTSSTICLSLDAKSLRCAPDLACSARKPAVSVCRSVEALNHPF